MARSVFDTGGEKPKGDGTKSARTGVRRQPLVKAGPASDKYIRTAAQGGTERTYQEISTDQIQDSKIQDRIDVKEDLESLIENIRERGQEIPIIVRIVQSDKPYEIVVGRRRLAAIRALGQPTIKAFVRKLSDQEAFVLQGVENNERLDTSFIEKARAASQALGSDLTHDAIGEFLNVSRSLITMMVTVYKDVGEEVVLAIGPARGIGRRRWEGLAELIRKSGVPKDEIPGLVDQSLDSVDRFDALNDQLRTGASLPKPARKTPVQSSKTVYLDGALSATRKPRQLVVKMDHTLPDDLLDDVQKYLEDLAGKWKSEQEEN